MYKEEVLLAEKFICIVLDNTDKNPKIIEKNIDSSYIQFHFALRGTPELTFNKGGYKLPVEEMNYLTLYNPEKNLPLNIKIENKSAISSIDNCNLVPIVTSLKYATGCKLRHLVAES